MSMKPGRVWKTTACVLLLAVVACAERTRARTALGGALDAGLAQIEARVRAACAWR